MFDEPIGARNREHDRGTEPETGQSGARGCGTAEYSRYQLAVCLLRRTDRDRLREFGIHESDGSPDEKERRPEAATTWLPSVQDGAVKCGLGVRREFPRLTQAHRAVPS